LGARQFALLFVLDAKRIELGAQFIKAYIQFFGLQFRTRWRLFRPFDLTNDLILPLQSAISNPTPVDLSGLGNKRLKRFDTEVRPQLGAAACSLNVFFPAMILSRTDVRSPIANIPIDRLSHQYLHRLSRSPAIASERKSAPSPSQTPAS
jgi:hypothetical protein